MTAFRVTEGMLASRSLAGLQTSLTRLSEIQEQLSTGRVLNRPSDSPTDTSTAMRLRASLTAVDQYTRNAEDGLSRLGVADQTLSDVTLQVNRARALATQGANAGTMSPSSREALATEVDQIRAGLLDDANTKYLAWPVFGGVTSGSTAYDDTGAYQGVDGSIIRRVGDGVAVDVAVSGKAVFGDGDTSVFAELDALSNALRSGDDAGVHTSLTALDNRLSTVATAHAGVGSTYNRVQSSISTLSSRELTLKTQLSNVENVDLPKATVDLNMQEVAYQAALGATAKVMQPSLLDFLR